MGQRDGPAKCPQCGYSHHFNPVTAVGVVLHDGDNVLLIRRGRNPGKGKLGLPGGFVDLGERAEEAAAREVHEELGVDIGPLEFLATFPNTYEYQGVDVQIVDIYFASPLDGSAAIRTAEGEIAEAVWTLVQPEVLKQMAFPPNAKALELWSQGRRT